MEIKFSMSGDVSVVAFLGKHDSQTFLDAEERLKELIKQGTRKILINFAELDYINSAGLRIILVAAKEIKNVKGELRLCSPNKLIKDVFEISGFLKIFKVFDDQKTALEGF